jgi:hypothetical protein
MCDRYEQDPRDAERETEIDADESTTTAESESSANPWFEYFGGDADIELL